MKRAVVVGLGSIAKRHRANLKELYPNIQIISLSSSGRIPDEPVCNSDYLLSDIKDLDFKLDLSIIASPSPFHVEHALPFIHKGIPTLIEKPVTASLEDAKRLIEAEKQSNTHVSVGYCLRFLPSLQKLEKLVRADKAGEIYNVFIEVGQYLPDWRSDKSYIDSVSANKNLGGGALLELSHELDYAQWLFGPLALEYGKLRSSQELKLEVEDSVDIVATNSSGAIINIHLDFLQRPARRTCRIIGSKGSIECDLIKNEICFNGINGRETLYSQPQWNKNNMYKNMIESFIASSNKLGCYNATLTNSAATVELIELIKLSAQKLNIDQ